jgi:hypothetical protein
MVLTNKLIIIIILIIIYFINYLTNGGIITRITNLLSYCKNNIENVNSTNTTINDKLYNFINQFINHNINTYELAKLNTERILFDRKLNIKIIDYIEKLLNSGEFIFSDIKLLNNLFYYKNINGKYLEIFKFSANVSSKNNNKLEKLGNLIFGMEIFIHDNILSEHITVLNIKLLGNNISENNLVESVNYTNNKFPYEFYDGLFIKPKETIVNDTENSLIPSIINISPDESSSD